MRFHGPEQMPEAAVSVELQSLHIGREALAWDVSQPAHAAPLWDLEQVLVLEIRQIAHHLAGCLAVDGDAAGGQRDDLIGGAGDGFVRDQRPPPEAFVERDPELLISGVDVH